MKVIVKHPGKAAAVEDVDNTLEALQGLVGGYIEVVSVATNCVLICNEEGRLLNLPYNCSIMHIDFYGPLIVAGADGCDFADSPVTLGGFNKYWLGEEAKQHG